MIGKALESLKSLSREELLGIVPGKYNDYALLDLAHSFEKEQKDEDREMAVIELILRSPVNDEMVAYSDLYLDLMNYYLRRKDYPAMVRWAVAQLGFVEQQDDDPLTVYNSWRDLGEMYLHAGELEAGIGIYTRLIERNPQDIFNYNILGMTLPRIGLNRLAVDVMEKGLRIIEKEDRDNVRQQFKDFLEEAQGNLDGGLDRTESLNPETVQALRDALKLEISEDANEEALLQHLWPLDRLIELDQEADAELDAEILRRGKALIPELIHLGMDGELVEETRGPWHAARLLNVLRVSSAPELDILANWLDRTKETEWQPWMSVGDQFNKIGGYTVGELEEFARDPSYARETRDSALSELVEREKLDPELRPRLVSLFRELLNREGADQAEEETFTAFIISSAVDLNEHALVPDIQKAFAEDRVDQRIIDEAFVYEKMGLPVPPRPPRRSDGLYLRIQCNACGRVREQFTHFVLIDQTSLEPDQEQGRSPYILDREYICPKCGAVEQYQMEPMQIIKLMRMNPDHLLSVLTNKKIDKPLKPDPRVFYVQGEAFGKLMHPLDTVDEYRRRIAISPRNGELYMRLGNTLRFIGRFGPALEMYRMAVELLPDDPEVLIPAATAEHDFGDLDAARQLYERCLKAAKGPKAIYDTGLDENDLTAVQGLQALDKHEMSPWEYQLTNVEGQPLAPVNRWPSGKAEKKDKRAKRHGKKR